MSIENYKKDYDNIPEVKLPVVTDGLNESFEIVTVEKTIETSVISINKKIFELLNDKDNANLLYEIKDKISKIPQREKQTFSICWLIIWEMANFFKGKNNKFYEEELKPLWNKYIFYVNQAKQKLSEAKFNELYKMLIESIDAATPEKPKEKKWNWWLFENFFRRRIRPAD